MKWYSQLINKTHRSSVVIIGGTPALKFNIIANSMYVPLLSM